MKIHHTADWQIGMHVGAGGARARAQRIATAIALAMVAREHQVDAVFVAGGVFEDNAVDRAHVQSVVDACASFGVPTYVLPGNPTYVLPGNHDPLTTGSVWEHGAWLGATNVHVLRTSEPLTMAPGITLYPCPALTKMSSADPTAWIANVA